MSKINREKFEAWYLENWGHTEDNHETLFERSPDDEYGYYRLGVRMSHQAWQAGNKASEAQLTALTSQLESVVAENAALKSAFDKPDAWLSWHSIPPTFYEPDRGGEYLQVHEQAGEKNDDGSDSWPVYRNPETETPATDAFLAEVRASGVEMFGQYHNFSEKLFIQKEAQKYAAQIRQEAK